MESKKLRKGTKKPICGRIFRTLGSLALAAWFSACPVRRHLNSDLATNVNPGDQPDKILYEKAANEIKHGRYDVGRLTLQTLINTYPDSEYLAKAKLSIADSYYNEGGVSGLTQAEAEYKDFITFFPTAPEAPEAQYRVGMAHFRLMAKADRDQSEAQQAEAEFKEFLLKYPDNPMMPRVKARLREAQEVLAQGDFRIAKFYYMRGANPAAKSRFQEIIDRYPNFSGADSALWYLGQTLERLKKPDQAVPYYARILTEHPVSPLADGAKERLVAMHQPIPRPTRATMARAKADALARSRPGPFAKFGGLMSGSPDTSATRHGPVHLGPPPPATVVAKGATSSTPSGNTVTVQPVSDASLKTGKPEDPKPSGSDAASNNDSNPPTDPPAAEASSTPPPSKKKGRFHFFRKMF